MNRQRRSGTLRIIGGTWRGRKIRFGAAPVGAALGLRPTLDRVRETLFSWLASDIRDARCLDLYAGTGALSFEALSRGAAHVVAVERSHRALRDLHKNKTLLGASRLTIVHGDALQYLQRHHAEPFDVIFVDPPFQSRLIPRTLAALARADCLFDDSLVYAEHDAHEDLVLDRHWVTERRRRAGATEFMLLRRAS